MPKRLLNGLAAILVVVAAGIAVIVAYRFSLEINRPLPNSAEDWSDGQVVTETRRYVLEGVQVHDRELILISSRTIDTLFGILTENSGAPEFIEPTPGTHGSYKSPLERICYLLPDSLESAPANPLLMPFLSFDDRDARRTALRQIVVTGHESSLPAIVVGLRTEELLSTTLDWMMYPIWNGTISPKIEPHIWPMLEELVRSSGEPKQAAIVMLGLNENRANVFLAAPEQFGFHNPRFGQILSAYDRANVLIDRNLLLPQIDQLEAQTNEQSRPFYSNQLLAHLGFWKHPDDYNLLAGFIEHEDETIAENAAEALLYWYDIPYGNVDLDKAADVPSAVSIRGAIDTLNYTVSEYGFMRYFRFEKGDNWKFARQGLIEIGATRSSEIFDEAVNVFGDVESAISRFERDPQVDEFSTSQLDKLEELSLQWVTCAERLNVKLAFYMIKHKEVFQRFERLPR